MPRDGRGSDAPRRAVERVGPSQVPQDPEHGDGTCPRYSWTSRWRSLIVTTTNTSIIEALRRPVESGQFTSWAFTRRAIDSGLVPSMGSIGACFYDAMTESIRSRRQVELLDRQRWRTRIELANAIFENLESWHNRQRRHTSLGMLTPVEFKTRHQQTTAACIHYHASRNPGTPTTSESLG